MKTLLLHVPKFNNVYPPIGDFIWLNYMPMGLLAIADRIHRIGMDIEVVHLGVEWIEDPQFKVADLLGEHAEIRAVGLTLHWHHQAYDVMEVARCLKQRQSDLFVFLGGDTASFFHREILSEFPMVDAVVRGHAEEPVLSLLNALKNDRSLTSVPNLTWRDGDRIRTNPLDFQAISRGGRQGVWTGCGRGRQGGRVTR